MKRIHPQNAIFTLILMLSAVLCVFSALLWHIYQLNHLNDDFSDLGMMANGHSMRPKRPGLMGVLHNEPSLDKPSPNEVREEHDVETRASKAAGWTKIEYEVLPSSTQKKDGKIQHASKAAKNGNQKGALAQGSYLPDHCLDMPKKGEIVLRGERHSGTNFIERIIRQNMYLYLNNMYQGYAEDATYGWKHGFLPPLGGRVPFNGTKDTLVVITRDVFMWLSKMMEEAYDPILNAKRKDGFSSFIRDTYSNSCHDDSNGKGGNGICESAPNLVQIRTQKYKQWLSNNPHNSTYVGTKESFLQSRIHVRLEDVASSPSNDSDTKKRQIKHIRDPLRQLCIKSPDRLRPVTTHTTLNMRYNKKKIKIDPEEEKMRMLKKYSKDDLRFVLSQLDLEFEKKIGYDYGYIYDILNT